MQPANANSPYSIDRTLMRPWPGDAPVRLGSIEISRSAFARLGAAAGELREPMSRTIERAIYEYVLRHHPHFG